MTLHVFLLLLLCVLMFSRARLCSLCWPHHGPAQSSAAIRRTPLQRLLKSRSPHDCPACRLSCAHSSVVGPVPAPVRPWREVKSRRGAPKRVNTEGFACPNRTCPYSGITDAHIHALVGDGTHGHAERIQTLKVRPWLYKITYHEYCRFIGRATPPAVPLALVEMGMVAQREEDQGRQPELLFERAERRLELDALVAALPERYREAVSLYYFEELSYQQVADVLDQPLGTVKSNVHRGIRLLRKHLSAQANEVL